jgi:RING-like zinc finger
MEQNNPDGTRRLSPEEEEEIQQLYLLERLGKYSTPVKAGDIKVKSGPTDPTAGYLTAVQSDNDDGFDEEAESSHNGEVTRAELSLVHDSNTFVRVPCAGQSIEYEDMSSRDVPNGCAICLSEFEVGDRITWASNRNCPHCFHEQCILKWMLAVGKKKRQQRSSNVGPQDDDPVQAAINFPKLCPCCRRQFISSVDIPQESSSMVGRSGESVVSVDNRIPVQPSSRVPQRDASTIASASVDLTDDHSMIALPDLGSPPNGDRPLTPGERAPRSAVLPQVSTNNNHIMFEDLSMVPRPAVASPSRIDLSSDDHSMVPQPDAPSPVHHVRTAALGDRSNLHVPNIAVTSLPNRTCDLPKVQASNVVLRSPIRAGVSPSVTDTAVGSPVTKKHTLVVESAPHRSTSNVHRKIDLDLDKQSMVPQTDENFTAQHASPGNLNQMIDVDDHSMFPQTDQNA